MSYWSDFCRYMNDNRQYLPGALFSEVRRAAMASVRCGAIDLA